MSWRLLSRLGSPGGAGGNLTVLFFHRVFATRDALMTGEPTAESFERMLGWLKSQFRMLPLDEAVRLRAENRLPAGSAALSFDDGYRDNFEVAAPILQRHGVPATFFIASGFLDGGLMWSDGVAEAIRHAKADTLDVPELALQGLPLHDWPARGAAVAMLLQRLKYLPFAERDQAVQAVERACGTERPRDLMMSSEQVRGLARQGFGIGGHTCHHPILMALPDAEAEREITQGRAQLQACIDAPVPLFAYPNGRAGKDYDDRHRAMVQRAGFAAGFSTEPGVCHAGSDPWALPRFTPWDRSEYRFRLRLLQNQWNRPSPSAVTPA
jgi:peptidoglycan/xylan/chitin deacetylase (PgdA/CDA1 family)